MTENIRWHLPELFDVIKIGFCPDETTWMKNRALVLRSSSIELRHYPHPEKAGMFTCWRDFNGKAYGVVTISGAYDGAIGQAFKVLAHECSHVVDKVFECAGEDAPGGETKAYLFGWAVHTMWSDYVKSGRAPKWMA